MEARALTDVRDDRRATQAALARPQSVEFANERIEKAVNRLNEISGVQFGIAHDALLEAGQPLDVRVNFRAEGRALSSILDEILLPLKLDWFVHDSGVIIVTSHARAADWLEIRAHRVAELIAAGRSERDLIRQITDRIEPASWSDNGGPAAVSTLPGVLLLRHNRRAHERIETLLKTLAD